MEKLESFHPLNDITSDDNASINSLIFEINELIDANAELKGMIQQLEYKIMDITPYS